VQENAFGMGNVENSYSKLTYTYELQNFKICRSKYRQYFSYFEQQRRCWRV